MKPRDKIEKAAVKGDAVVVMGGRTGRDGIHGATFSSAELTDTHADEFSHAVQIGNAITEKKVQDVIVAARDRGLTVRMARVDTRTGTLDWDHLRSLLSPRTRNAQVEMFQSPPMTADLSGLKLEYAIALIYSTEAGKREAVLGTWDRQAEENKVNVRLHSEVAARGVSLSDLVQRRMLLLAPFPCVRATVTEATARWPGGRRPSL